MPQWINGQRCDENGIPIYERTRVGRNSILKAMDPETQQHRIWAVVAVVAATLLAATISFGVYMSTRENKYQQQKKALLYSVCLKVGRSPGDCAFAIYGGKP